MMFDSQSDAGSPFARAAELERLNIPFAIVTLTHAEGTTPRSNGRMTVVADGTSYGTVGGGVAESYAIKQAVRMIDAGQGGAISFVTRHECETETSTVDMFVDVVCSGKKVVLVGGGHVNFAIAQLASNVGFEVELVEIRPEYATAERFPMASRIHLDETVERSLQDVLITSTTAVVVSSYAVDLPVVERLLASPACYVGLLGSRHKARTMIQALEASGLDEASMGKLFVPIGLDIGGETPQEIAVGVVAEIMQVLHHRPGGHLCGAIPRQSGR